MAAVVYPLMTASTSPMYQLQLNHRTVQFSIPKCMDPRSFTTERFFTTNNLKKQQQEIVLKNMMILSSLPNRVTFLMERHINSTNNVSASRVTSKFRPIHDDNISIAR